MCGGYGCSRNALAALNVLYILVAFIIIGVAGYAKASTYVSNIAAIGGVIACGVVLLLVALAGLIGACKHHQVCLFFYMIILFLLFILQFALACICLAVNSEQQQQLAEIGWKAAGTQDKADCQKGLSCCGWNPTDLDNLNMTSKDGLWHPKCENITCCLGSKAKCCVGQETGDDSKCPCSDNTCFSKISAHMDSAVKIAGGVGLFFSFTEIVGVWLALRFRNQKDPRANPNAFL